MRATAFCRSSDARCTPVHREMVLSLVCSAWSRCCRSFAPRCVSTRALPCRAPTSRLVSVKKQPTTTKTTNRARPSKERRKHPGIYMGEPRIARKSDGRARLVGFCFFTLTSIRLRVVDRPTCMKCWYDLGEGSFKLASSTLQSGQQHTATSRKLSTTRRCRESQAACKFPP